MSRVHLMVLSILFFSLMTCAMNHDHALVLEETIDSYSSSSQLYGVKYEKNTILDVKKNEQSDDARSELKLQKSSGTCQSVMYQKHLYDSYRAAIQFVYCVGKANQCMPVIQQSEALYKKKIKNTGAILLTTCTAEIQKKLFEAYIKNPLLFNNVAQYIIEEKSDYFYKNGYEQALKDVATIVGGGSIIYFGWVFFSK